MLFLSKPLTNANLCGILVKSAKDMGEFPSGQRGQTVNLLSMTSLVRIQLPPPRKNAVRDCVFSIQFDRVELVCHRIAGADGIPTKSGMASTTARSMTFVEWITFRATRAMRGFHTAYGGFHTLGSRAILCRTLRGAELSPLRTARQNTPMLAKWYRVPPEKCDVFLYHSETT